MPNPYFPAGQEEIDDIPEEVDEVEIETKKSYEDNLDDMLNKIRNSYRKDI